MAYKIKLSGFGVLFLCFIVFANSQNPDEFFVSQGHLFVSKESSGNSFPLYGVVFNKKEIIPKDTDIKKIVGFFSGDKSSIFVLQRITGGSACPAIYQIIEVHSRDSVEMSKEFGNCSDLVKTYRDKMDKLVVIVIHNDKWKYKDGEVKKVAANNK